MSPVASRPPAWPHCVQTQSMQMQRTRQAHCRFCPNTWWQGLAIHGHEHGLHASYNCLCVQVEPARPQPLPRLMSPGSFLPCLQWLQLPRPRWLRQWAQARSSAAPGHMHLDRSSRRWRSGRRALGSCRRRSCRRWGSHRRLRCRHRHRRRRRRPHHGVAAACGHRHCSGRGLCARSNRRRGRWGGRVQRQREHDADRAVVAARRVGQVEAVVHAVRQRLRHLHMSTYSLL